MVLSNLLVPSVRGWVTVTSRDQQGRVIDSITKHNAYTNLAAIDHARALAGEAHDLAFSHIGLGQAGFTITDGGSTSGWTGGSLDTVNYRQGNASLYFAATANSNVTHYNQTTCASQDASGASGSIEVWTRLLLRANTDLANTEIRVYTGGGSAYYKVSFTSLETIKGSQFQDGTWALLRIPTTSFSTGAGSPSWAAVTGAGVKVTANSNGTATVYLDDLRFYPASINTGQTATSVPNEFTKRIVSTLGRANASVTTTAFWTDYEAVGQYYVFGLYGNAGYTLAAILPLSYYKAAAATLSVSWTVIPQGG